ncbi:MAG: excinuclease ABC subunit UvrC [Patescibacteria group bacterium]|nr:excinuclease ABC subunit UvrC [Patescibacteria group bacterium]MDW8279977.1 excinuclease ABC subunit UvrC [bacterium]
MTDSLLEKIKKFPENSGVYLMRDDKSKILYIGKASNLKRRVSSYFLKAHEERIENLLKEVKKIDYILTDNSLEALILESNLIKKYKPKYNIREKDDKSFLYVLITKEKFPRILLIRGKDINLYNGELFGPFVSAKSIRSGLKIIRKIFPYNLHCEKDINRGKPCFDYQIGLCPGTCIGAISEKEYKKNIINIKLFLKGEKNQIIKKLETEMNNLSKNMEFEKAAKIRNQIFAINHIKDIALIKDDDFIENINYKNNKKNRIEGFDISNISGLFAVGSMVVFYNNLPAKKEYRKFKIKNVVGIDDFKMLEEILKRRFSHQEWPLPDLILIDGGLGQINIARKVLKYFNLNIPIIGIAKGPKRKKNEFIGRVPSWTNEDILIKVRNEAHRFAIDYHRQLRNKLFIAK